MTDRIGPLLQELVSAREALFATLDAIPTDRLGRPGLIGDWSAQELVAHVGYWAGHAVELIQAAELGTLEQFDEGQPGVDDVNERVARVARDTDFATVRKREQAAFDVLAERLRRLDASLLDLRLADGATVETGLREDGSGHYRQHADELAGVLARG